MFHAKLLVQGSTEVFNNICPRYVFIVYMYLIDAALF